jgi:hypothetical protein
MRVMKTNTIIQVVLTGIILFLGYILVLPEQPRVADRRLPGLLSLATDSDASTGADASTDTLSLDGAETEGALTVSTHGRFAGFQDHHR